MRLFIDGVVMQSLSVVLATVVYLTFLIRIHTGLALACPVRAPPALPPCGWLFPLAATGL